MRLIDADSLKYKEIQYWDGELHKWVVADIDGAPTVEIDIPHWTPLDTGEYPPLFKDVYITLADSVRPVIGRWWGNKWTCDSYSNALYDGSVLAWMDLPEPYQQTVNARWLIKEEREELGILGRVE